MESDSLCKRHPVTRHQEQAEWQRELSTGRHGSTHSHRRCETSLPGAGGSGSSVNADTHQVSQDYFRAFRIPLLVGRSFRDDDGAGRPLVAIVKDRLKQLGKQEVK